MTPPLPIRPVRADDAPALVRMREHAGWEVEKVPAWIANAAAIALYESLGYRLWKEADRPWGRAVFLRKRLGPPGTIA